MNNLYCRFCSKELKIPSHLQNCYELEPNCCRSTYRIQRFDLSDPFKMIYVRFDLFHYRDIQYSVQYDCDEDTTSFSLNNIADLDKPGASSYVFEGFVDRKKFIRLMNLRAFW